MHSEIVRGDLPLDMANAEGNSPRVSWFTIFAGEMTQYARKKIFRISLRQDRT